MKLHKVYCLFEQSGTFKNEFKRFGIDAEDYDILNEFGETDHVIDLFEEINKAYEGKPSLFDSIGDCDLVFAFFPCTSFEARVPLNSRCEGFQFKNYKDIQKLEYSMNINAQISVMYTLICKLFTVCLRGGWRMIVENPYTPPHYLTQYFPIRPKVIDKDRTKNGDHFKKPTQYWFVNCDPEQNITFEPIDYVKQHTIELAHLMSNEYGKERNVRRSMIHNQYARRFIQDYILDAKGGVWAEPQLDGQIGFEVEE